MSTDIKLNVEPVRSLGFASILASYVGVGTALDKPARIILFQNLTNESLMISFDGIDDHIPMAKAGYMLLDISANKTTETGFFLPEGSRIYIKEIGTPTTGSFYFTVFYGGNE